MASYQEYRDEEVSFILVDEELTDQGKLIRIKNHYKARLTSSGQNSQAIKFIEKEIREEILYEQKRIQTAFNNLSFSRNEISENLAMGNLRIMQEALATALAEIAYYFVNSGNVDIPTRDQHEIDEARRTGREAEEIKGIHADQLKKAQEFHEEAKSWGLLLWGGFILLIVGAYVYMYSPLIIQAIHGIGESGTDEARRTQNLVTTLVYVFGAVLVFAGLGVLYRAGIQSIAYPFALMGWIVDWAKLKKSLKKTQSYNGEARSETKRALLWAISPTFLFLGIFAYYIFQPLASRQPTSVVANSFKSNALVNKDGVPVRDAPNSNGSIVETLSLNSPIFVPNRTFTGKGFYEVKTQSGKSGWIHGNAFGFSENEVASDTSNSANMVNTNLSMANSNLPSMQPTNLSQPSNSSEVATATPYSNPLVESTPKPLDNPENSYKEIRVNFVKGMSQMLGGFTEISSDRNKYFDFDGFNREFNSFDSSLKNIVYTSDQDSLQSFGSFIGTYLTSILKEAVSVTYKYEGIARIKYQNELLPNDAPEKEARFEEGYNLRQKKLAQLGQMLKSISNTSKGIAREKLIEQFKSQLDRDIQVSEQKIQEISLKMREAGR